MTGFVRGQLEDIHLLEMYEGNTETMCLSLRNVKKEIEIYLKFNLTVFELDQQYILIAFSISCNAELP